MDGQKEIIEGDNKERKKKCIFWYQHISICSSLTSVGKNNMFNQGVCRSNALFKLPYTTLPKNAYSKTVKKKHASQNKRLTVFELQFCPVFQ